jgi:hypothetical protein
MLIHAFSTHLTSPISIFYFHYPQFFGTLVVSKKEILGPWICLDDLGLVFDQLSDWNCAILSYSTTGATGYPGACVVDDIFKFRAGFPVYADRMVVKQAAFYAMRCDLAGYGVCCDGPGYWVGTIGRLVFTGFALYDFLMDC